jgi:hypothetical protein
LADLPEMETFIDQPFGEDEPILQSAPEMPPQVDFIDNSDAPA